MPRGAAQPEAVPKGARRKRATIHSTEPVSALNKEEYKAYIKGRGDWGTGVFTDERYDDAAWRLQCQKAECPAEEGITRSAFERLMYGKYRRGRGQDDREKCAEWVAMSDAQRRSHENKTSAAQADGRL